VTNSAVRPPVEPAGSAGVVLEFAPAAAAVVVVAVVVVVFVAAAAAMKDEPFVLVVKIAEGLAEFVEFVVFVALPFVVQPFGLFAVCSAGLEQELE